MVELPAGGRWAFEIKRTTSISTSRGFHAARQDLDPLRTWIVTPGDDAYDRQEGVHVSGLRPLLRELQSAV